MNRTVCLTFLLLWISVSAICAGGLENRSFRGTDYLVIRADSAQVQLHWKDGDGNAIGTISRMVSGEDAKSARQPTAFAGMFSVITQKEP